MGRSEDNKLITKTLSPDEVQANCDKYGRLYNWNTAMAACPAGWHLSHYKDWWDLEQAVSPSQGPQGMGTRLKSRTGWAGNGNGTDDFGFSALPGGECGPIRGRNNVCDAGNCGHWWSAQEYADRYGKDINLAINYEVNGDGYMLYTQNLRTEMFSVRCVQNKEGEQ
jgi:uncharacterized protein (TIGR02145 family)